ncbi:MAG: Bro-N domain-containing protein [Mangrovibacterium sp.]
MQLAIFNYQSPEEHSFNEIKTVEIDGEIWFVGADVAKALGYKRPSEAIRQHCKERGTVKHRNPTSSGEQEMVLISEPNVYRLIIKSQLPSAERFETWLFEEVIPSIRKKGYYGRIDRSQLPNFITRYKDNYHKLPSDYFSVISEMFARLYIELEKVGYVIPDKGAGGKQMMPDISVGKGFAKYLRDNNSEFIDTHKKYMHTFPDGREVEANMYHIDALPTFIKYINDKWIPENAEMYFKTRDPLALDYLPKMLKERNKSN